MIVPVILSGGSGTRLWPLSRSLHPKQHIPNLVTPGASLFTATLLRVAPDDGVASPIIVANAAHRFLVMEQCDDAGIVPQAVILEPAGRNTAPAIAAVALLAAERDPATVLAVLPSDHVVGDGEQFGRALQVAAALAQDGRIALFGVPPTEAHTGYGYIEIGEPIEAGTGPALAVKQFAEKPDAETARRYLATGHHLWNSGMFVFRADVVLGEFEALAPDVLAAARVAIKQATREGGFIRLDAEALARSPAISFDRAVMERTTRAAVVPLDAGWSDLGSWSALCEVAPRDGDGNAVSGDAILEESRNCYVRSDGRLVSTLGVSDLVIVDTADSVLVAHKTRAQDVSRIVSRLKATNRPEHERHTRTHRPWGYFDTLNAGSRFQVKLLHVKPGGQLSLQMHCHRSEHWVVVQGEAKVTVDGGERRVSENESVHIVAGQWHRLENPGEAPLVLVEVQVGAYLGEDDIIRSDDAYARATDETC